VCVCVCVCVCARCSCMSVGVGTIWSTRVLPRNSNHLIVKQSNEMTVHVRFTDHHDGQLQWVFF
jgi:hypothetical protein